MKANQKVRNGKKMTKKLDDMPFVMINLDKPRKIRFTSWSVVEMESRYKRKLGPMYKDVQEGNVGLVDNMILLRAGLLEEMPALENCPTPPEGNIMLDASLKYVTRLYDAAEDRDSIMKQLGEAFSSAMGGQAGLTDEEKAKNEEPTE